jgi:hypothetical protein
MTSSKWPNRSTSPEMTATAAFSAGAVAIVLVIAGAAKIAARSSLVPVLLTVGLPHRVATVTAKCVPFAEIALGLMLAVGVAPRAGGFAAVALAVAFTVVQLLMRRRNVELPCNCFGGHVRSIAGVALVRTILFAVAASLAASTATRWAAAPRIPTVWTALGTLAGATTVLAFALVEEVLSFERSRPRPLKAAIREAR